MYTSEIYTRTDINDTENRKWNRYPEIQETLPATGRKAGQENRIIQDHIRHIHTADIGQALKKTNAGGAHKETVRYDATVRAPQGQLPDENEFRCGFQSSAKNPGSGKFCPEKNADILPAVPPEGTVAA